MDELNFITTLDGHLRACISLACGDELASFWKMTVQLFYDGESAGTTSFKLHGYNREEAEDVARNLNRNAYLMREIDEFLWGESD